MGATCPATDILHLIDFRRGAHKNSNPLLCNGGRTLAQFSKRCGMRKRKAAGSIKNLVKLTVVHRPQKNLRFVRAQIYFNCNKSVPTAYSGRYNRKKAVWYRLQTGDLFVCDFNRINYW
jgi:hypothetical protein